MCEYIKRMAPQDMPTDDIRCWSGLAHSVVEYTGPKPFGMDGSVYLWLHERSATQLLNMCDELDAKFSGLKSENAKLRESAKAAWILFLKYGAVSPQELPEVDEVRESLNELGIKVSWEELGIDG